MLAWLRRTLTFTRFTLQEYLRSGRILVELLSLVIVIWVIFWPRGSQGTDLHQFLNLAGLLMLALTTYTTMAMMRLGNRPEGYVVLARPLGRSGYLIGLFLAAFIVSAAIYLLLSFAIPPLNGLKGQPLNLDVLGWLLSTLPLLLDVAIVSSFVMLLAPLVVPNRPRLALLALLAIALTSDFQWIGTGELGSILQPVQTVLALLLAPVLSGFELAVEHHYDLTALGIMVSQVALMAVLLAASLYAFRRRELILVS